MEKLITLIISTLIVFQLAAQDIIFTRQINNNDNLLVMYENGNVETLTNHPRKDSSPMISPDGKMVVFTSERVGWWKIWTMNLESKEVKQLTDKSSADYSPSWSLDGKQIVFTSSRDGNQEVYVMDEDGSNQRNITKNSSEDTMPYWGTDGYIYYSTEVDGVYQIARIKPNGANKEIWTDTPGNKLMPQLSKDGTKILYYGDQDGNMEIYLLDINTERTTRLTNHPLMDIRPRWSVDNAKIVFERGNKGNNHHIYIMDADGSSLKQLTSKNYNYTPSFFPR